MQPASAPEPQPAAANNPAAKAIFAEGFGWSTSAREESHSFASLDMFLPLLFLAWMAASG